MWNSKIYNDFHNCCVGYYDIHDVHRFVLNELNANNIYDNFKIKKLNNTYIIICPSVQIAEKLLQINTERFKLRSVHQDSKDIKYYSVLIKN